MAGADWLGTLVALENGKALADAKGEILYAAEFFRWYAEEAVRVLGEVSIERPAAPTASSPNTSPSAYRC